MGIIFGVAYDRTALWRGGRRLQAVVVILPGSPAIGLDYGANLNDHRRYGLTALHYAVRGGKLPPIKLLLARGARADALDESGLTPLLQLSNTRSQADPVPVMEFLAASGANVDARDKNQSSLLMYFARRGNADAVQWLLAHGVDRNARNMNGKTAAQIGRAHRALACKSLMN